MPHLVTGPGEASDSNLGTDTCKEGPGSHPHGIFLPFLGSPQAGLHLLLGNPSEV